MSRRGLWLGVAAAVLVAAGAGWWYSRGSKQAAVASPGVGAAAKAASAAGSTTNAIELAAGDVVRARQAELVTQLAVSGSLKAVDSAFVKAKVAAELKQLPVREGDRVQAGQVIGRLDTTEFDWRLRQAEDQARAAEAQLQIAERTLANNRQLVEQGFISRNALDTSASNRAAQDASLQAARAAVELARKAVADTVVRAPIGGLVAQRFVQAGERVGVDARIVEIVDLSRLELEAAVPPDEVLALRLGQRAAVRIDGLAEPVPARVARISPSATPGTRTVLAYLLLEPAEEARAGLRQGLFARATVDLLRKPALVVPASALRFDQARPYVLVLDAGVARVRAVGLGARGEALFDGRREAAVEITDGLASDAVVLRATVGALREGTRLALRAGATTAPSAAGTAGGTTPANGASAAR